MLSKAFTTRQVAELAHVSQSTIANWISAGILPAFRTPGGHHRILPRDFVRFLEEHGFPVPEELQAQARVKVLIVDEPEPAKHLAERLSELEDRYEIAIAEGGVEGLLRIGLDRPDIVVLDLHLPDLSGSEICRQVRLNPETHRTQFIALSARKSDQIRQISQKLGALELFFKPIEPRELLKALNAVRFSPRKTGEVPLLQKQG